MKGQLSAVGGRNPSVFFKQNITPGEFTPMLGFNMPFFGGNSSSGKESHLTQIISFFIS